MATEVYRPAQSAAVDYYNQAGNGMFVGPEPDPFVGPRLSQGGSNKPKWSGPAVAPQSLDPQATWETYTGRDVHGAASTQFGVNEDAVRIMIYDSSGKQLEQLEVLNAENWAIEETVLSQPSRWTATVGYGGIVSQLMQLFKPRTRYELWIGNALQTTGLLDGFEVEQVGQGTRLVMKGRDILAPVFDAYVAAEENFADSTYADMVRRVMKRLGIDPALLIASKTADRQMKAGVPIDQIMEPQVVEQIYGGNVVGATVGGAPAAGQSQKLQAKIGERWHDFIRRHIDRAGLCLWAASNGRLILSAPNVRQAPAYKIVRRRGAEDNPVNVLTAHYTFDCTNRHSEILVYARGGGRKYGRTKVKGGFVDDEMETFGYKQPRVIKDADVTNETQAGLLARRLLAEERREGIRLEYTIAGHRLPFLQNGRMTGQMAVVTTDTLVEVEDDELGIRGTYYIDSVRRSRSPSTQTWIRLVRPGDMLFADVDNAIVQYKPAPGSFVTNRTNSGPGAVGMSAIMGMDLVGAGGLFHNLPSGPRSVFGPPPPGYNPLKLPSGPTPNPLTSAGSTPRTPIGPSPVGYNPIKL